MILIQRIMYHYLFIYPTLFQVKSFIYFIQYLFFINIYYFFLDFISLPVSDIKHDIKEIIKLTPNFKSGHIDTDENINSEDILVSNYPVKPRPRSLQNSSQSSNQVSNKTKTSENTVSQNGTASQNSSTANAEDTVNQTKDEEGNNNSFLTSEDNQVEISIEIIKRIFARYPELLEAENMREDLELSTEALKKTYEIESKSFSENKVEHESYFKLLQAIGLRNLKLHSGYTRQALIYWALLLSLKIFRFEFSSEGFKRKVSILEENETYETKDYFSELEDNFIDSSDSLKQISIGIDGYQMKVPLVLGDHLLCSIPLGDKETVFELLEVVGIHPKSRQVTVRKVENSDINECLNSVIFLMDIKDKTQMLEIIKKSEKNPSIFTISLSSSLVYKLFYDNLLEKIGLNSLNKYWDTIKNSLTLNMKQFSELSKLCMNQNDLTSSTFDLIDTSDYTDHDSISNDEDDIEETNSNDSSNNVSTSSSEDENKEPDSSESNKDIEGESITNSQSHSAQNQSNEEKYPLKTNLYSSITRSMLLQKLTKASQFYSSYFFNSKHLSLLFSPTSSMSDIVARIMEINPQEELLQNHNESFYSSTTSTNNSSSPSTSSKLDMTPINNYNKFVDEKELPSSIFSMINFELSSLKKVESNHRLGTSGNLGWDTDIDSLKNTLHQYSKEVQELERERQRLQNETTRLREKSLKFTTRTSSLRLSLYTRRIAHRNILQSKGFTPLSPIHPTSSSSSHNEKNSNPRISVRVTRRVEELNKLEKKDSEKSNEKSYLNGNERRNTKSSASEVDNNDHHDDEEDHDNNNEENPRKRAKRRRVH